MGAVLTWLRTAGRWAWVGLAVALMVLFGLWRSARGLVLRTKAQLADERAGREAAERSAQRERVIAADGARLEAAHLLRGEAIRRELAQRSVLSARADEAVRAGVLSTGSAADEVNRRAAVRDAAAKRGL